MAVSKIPCFDEAMEVLQQAKAAAARGNLAVTKHARDRMRERRAQAGDVDAAIAGATKATVQESGAWKLRCGSRGRRA